MTKKEEDNVRRKSTIQVLEYARSLGAYNRYGKEDIGKNIAWLKKQGEQTKQAHFPKFTFDDVLALQCCMETVKKVQEDKELYEKLNLIHSKIYDAYRIENQDEQASLQSNKNIDLTKILNDCPKGWKFWSPIFGEVEFVRNYRDKGFVNVSVKDSSEWSFASDATIFFGNIKSREVMLYPSKELRDWSKFTAPWYKKNNPKFKVGDWIISSVLGIAHVIGVNDSNEYQLEYIDGKQKFSSIDYVNYAYNKWTIKDAKDGDVIQLGQIIVIFKKYIGEEKCICYCSFCKDVGFEIPIEDGEDNVYGCYNATPAIRKYCDYLMNAMNNAGYKWDVEDKELKKLVLNRFDPDTLQPFDKVLARDSYSQDWTCGLFSHIYVFNNICKYNVGEILYKMCIPYNDDTKHLVGTTDEAPKYYRYWED